MALRILLICPDEAGQEPASWEEWLNLVVGLCALVSPWVLGFHGSTAMTVHVVIGAAGAILAAIELWMMSQIPPRLTTGR